MPGAIVLPDYAALHGAVGNDWFELDPNLSFLLDRHLPDPADRTFAEEQVAPYGALVGITIAPRAEETDAHGPVLRRYGPWGDEVGDVVHHPTWLASKADLIAAGFVGLPRHAGRPVPGVVSASCAYLVSQAETAIYCALGMTGGTADIVERYAPDSVRDELLARLTDLNPEQAWEGGMFLTERQGGSDVGANTTTAVRDGDEWALVGDKHFCSNVDADVFVVLARPDGAPAGTRGLATFIVPRRLPDGTANGFVVKRLKPKLGTIGVPTGEVTLNGARAWLAAGGPGAGTEGLRADPAPDGRGINRMMEMVGTSRFGVALMGLGIHRRSFLEAVIYAARRTQWGQRIDRYPLVRETLVDLLVELEAGMSLTYECAVARRDSAGAEEGRLLRRLLVPLAKVRTTRAALAAASTALELFGGNGYMTDWPMARQLRDAQCHTIWEGTENILCLDVRRAIRGERANLALESRVERALDEAAPHRVLAGTVDRVAAALHDVRTALAHLEGVPEDLALLHGRRMTELLADLAEAGLLLNDAAWSLSRDGDARKAVVARRFGDRRLSDAPVRGILSDDRTVLDLFEPITRYGRVEADRLRA
ncbi:MAG TPA: acyl-CoA dehydrogenase family protein [Acidimicrobiales bacterium]|nr:acyl-CoA dehydrogenase family protein [Acidimicrobiales bacterium]